MVVKNQMADTEVQEQLVRTSGLDWTLIQPVPLTDADREGAPLVSTTAQTRTLKVSRAAVGVVHARAMGA